MKVHLEADPQEILEKGPELIQKLAQRLGVDISELINHEDLLQKATEVQKEPQLKHAVLRGIHDQEQTLYEKQMKEMLEEIGGLLNSSMKKGYADTIHSEDQKKFQAVRQKLKDTKGYRDEDFDHPRGVLHGMSTNELVDLVGG